MKGRDVLFSSDTNEHYTPMWILNKVVNVMGGIDCDPCADPLKRVPAKVHYTKEDDGFTRPWKGRVFMNPEYGPRCKHWIKQLDFNLRREHTDQFIALVAARTDTEWHQSMQHYMACYLRGRLLFLDEDYQDQEYSAPFPSVLFYGGPYCNHEKFYEEWKDYGEIRVPYKEQLW